MNYLVIVEANVAELSWVPEYMSAVAPLVEEFGGHYVTRTSQVELLEGEDRAPQFSLVAEFPSRESAKAFYQSEGYAPYKLLRQNGASCKILLAAVENSTGLDK